MTFSRTSATEGSEPDRQADYRSPMLSVGDRDVVNRSVRVEFGVLLIPRARKNAAKQTKAAVLIDLRRLEVTDSLPIIHNRVTEGRETESRPTYDITHSTRLLFGM